ncbi:MAG: nickel pincer cofactor biosynthesis protein LarC, partial [Actinomycetota bacterium]
MTTAWFHCFAGTAGDMTMAALVAAGADPLEVIDIVGALPLDGYALAFERVQRCGVGATQALVAVHEHDHHHDHALHRPYAHIRTLLDEADLPARVRDRAHRTFRALAEVEAAIHGTSIDEVEFHEVGAVDAIVDVVGACAALEVLGVDRIVCSTISVGTGTVRAAHGVLPNPAPAVVALLAGRGAPSAGVAEPMELATPTGVALMTALADEFGPMPAMQVRAVGYGAGSRD